MPAHDLDAVFYVSRVPLIEFHDGAFHVSYEVGKCRFEFAMQPSVFLKAMAVARKARDAFEAAKAQVLPVEFDAKFEKVFPDKKDCA